MFLTMEKKNWEFIVYWQYILIGLGSVSNGSDMLVVVNSEYKTQVWPTLYDNLNFIFFDII